MRITDETEKKIEELLNEMTTEEKVAMCHGNSKFTSSGIGRLGIDELCMMDGSHGVRSEIMRDEWVCLNREEDKCTYLPTLSALAATFNPKLAKRFGETLGSEARYRGKDIILGPGVNIIRTPLCGRNFEYMSEDPCLISGISAEVVKGIELQDVAACVKHFALNNQELNRNGVNIEVSERALYEIYLKGFYSAIIDGGASSVMGAYNRYKQQYLCHNKYLVNDVLKGKWGFKGVYLSDWAGCHNTYEAIFGGLDLEMGTDKPYNEYYLADAFLEAAESDKSVSEILDDKVRRILRLIFSINKMSPNRKKGEFNTADHQKTAYDIASEAIVLLKNDDGLLPIKKVKHGRILVIGPNAKARHAEGGSSSGVRALYEITPYEGIVNRLGGDFEIDYESGNIDLKPNPIPTQLLNIIEQRAGVRAFRHTTYNSVNGEIKVSVSYSADSLLPDSASDHYKIEFSVRAPESGTYLFKIKSNVGVELFLDGKRALKQNTNMWNAQRGICASFEYASDFSENQNVEIVLKITNEVKNAIFEFGWNTPSEIAGVSGEEQLVNKVKAADYVIYCGGLNHSLDTEGADRRNMELPSSQNIIIDKLLSINENVIVTLTAGSPVEMPWIDRVKAVIWNWYAGMEGGNALADILCGNTAPSGKMPFTLPEKYEDCPASRYGEYQSGNCRYNEDIFVGYRGFDKDNIAPMFSFGHGLSYVNFDYSDLTVCEHKDFVEISLSVKNTGVIIAKETVQVYFGLEKSKIKRAKKELCAFKKTEIPAGEKTRISIFVKKRDMSFYNEVSHSFEFEAGEYGFYVGSSSRDIRLIGKVRLKG